MKITGTPIPPESFIAEIERLRPHYQSITATDAGRRQMLDHFERFVQTIDITSVQIPMDRSKQFEDGFHHALGRCVTWLHERANLMNDPHARAILNSAANALGGHGFTKDKPG